MAMGFQKSSTHGRSRGGEENEASQVRGALVGHSTGGVDQGADGVCLSEAANEGGTDGLMVR